MKEKKYKSVTTIFRESYEVVRRNLGLFLLVNVLSLVSVAWRVGSDLKDKTHGQDWSQVVGHSLFGGGDYPNVGSPFIIFVFLVLTILLALFGVILSLRAAQGKKLSFEAVWAELKAKGGRLFLIELLTILIIGVGFLFLIVPGIILLGRLIMSPFVLLDQNTGIKEAMDKSWAMSKGNMSPILAVIGFGILLGLTNIVPIVGQIVGFGLAVAYSAALPLRYLELKKKAAKQ